jgi:YVTN family beta-propeller protein
MQTLRRIAALAPILCIPVAVWCFQELRVMLPNGWLVSPSGVTSVKLGTMPIRMLPDPSGHWVITQQGKGEDWLGGEYAILVLNAKTGEIAHRMPVPGLYHGMAFADGGKTLFVSGGGTGLVYRFAFDAADGGLTKQADLSMRPTTQGGSFTHGTFNPWIGGIAVSGDGATIYAAAMTDNAVLARDAKLGVGKWTAPVSRYPYEIIRVAAQDKLFVTSWMTSNVDVIQESTGKHLATIYIGPHPSTAILSRDQSALYVACSYSNLVAVIDTEANRVRKMIDVSLYHGSPIGSTPVGLALTGDDRYLLVANADNNAVMMVDTASEEVVGAIPTGWYPTDVAVTADNTHVLIVSGLGSGVWKADFAIPERPFEPRYSTPERKKAFFSWLFGQQDAILQIVPMPDERTARAGLEEARSNSPYRPENLNRTAALPPIKHVIYVIRENKTYDSILGDNPRGDGDPSLCLFGKRITPNAHRLADDFVLLDNFFLEEGGSSTGHQYINSAYVGDHIRRFPRWRGPAQRPSFPDDRPPLGYLWDHAIAHGVTVRNYWEGLREDQGDGDGEPDSDDPMLKGHMVAKYIDRYHDLQKADEWIREFRQFEKNGGFPQFQVVFLGQDHTSGTKPYYKTPNADVAENDWALGRIIETLSHSRYWKDTVVFVIQDDSGQLPDHVGAARSVFLVAGGYVKRGLVDHTRYSVASVIATIEMILGLPPMSQFDASATLMTNLFSTTPDLTPWKASAPLVDINERNGPLSVAAKLSAELDDRGIDLDNTRLACVLWEYAKGTDLCGDDIRGFPASTNPQGPKAEARKTGTKGGPKS